MTNSNKAEAFNLRRARAAYLKQLCTNERWSGRAIAMKTGVAHSTIAAKLKGESPIELDDIALFEEVLEMEKGELYMKLLEVDSNHQPAGSQSAASNRGLAPVTPLPLRDTLSPAHNKHATVTPIHAAR